MMSHMEDGNSKTTLHHRRDGFSALGDYFPGLDVEITIDSTDATVYTMLEYFQRFLISAGYHEEKLHRCVLQSHRRARALPTRKEKARANQERRNWRPPQIPHGRNWHRLRQLLLQRQKKHRVRHLISFRGKCFQSDLTSRRRNVYAGLSVKTT